MLRPPPIPTRTDTLFPYPTRFRSRLTLPLAALDVTAFLFIEIDQFGDPHFLAFGLELSGWIGAGGSTAKNFPGLSARLLRRQGSISANRDTTFRRSAAATLGAVLRQERLDPARFDPKAEAPQLTIPEMIALFSRKRGIYNPLCERNIPGFA